MWDCNIASEPNFLKSHSKSTILSLTPVICHLPPPKQQHFAAVGDQSLAVTSGPGHWHTPAPNSAEINNGKS